MSTHDPEDVLVARALPVAEGLVDCVRRRDGAGVERLLACRRRTDREWYALAIVLAELVSARRVAADERRPRTGGAANYRALAHAIGAVDDYTEVAS